MDFLLEIVECVPKIKNQDEVINNTISMSKLFSTSTNSQTQTRNQKTY
jgi:hypothetical protein